MTGFESKRQAAKAKPVALAHSRHAKLMAKFTENAESMKALAQAEPVATLFGSLPVYDTTPPQQQAEPVTREGFNVWWDGDYDDSDNRFEKDSAAYWAWAGWQAAQRKELSASEILNMMPSAIPAEYDGELMEFARAVEAKLKERNT